MSVLRMNKGALLRSATVRGLSALAKEQEYTASPQYPPILDPHPDKARERRKEAEQEAIKAVKTVEEKQIKLNMPKYYGFKSYMLHEDYIPYNSLILSQHVTRTHLAESTALPSYYNQIEIDPALLNELKGDIEEAVLIELDGYQRIHDLRNAEMEEVDQENIISASMSKNINRTLINGLSKKCPHLEDIQIDLDARIESFWLAGGMKPPENIKKYREGQEWQKYRKDEPTNRAMNYIGSANVAIRSDHPLLPIVSESEGENPELEVPFYDLDPRTVGVSTKHRHISNIPGFWPGTNKRFGLLSYHKRGHILGRHYQDAEDDKEAIHRQGILSSFSWLNSQANFLGFNTFNDITYPLTTQTIITNGKTWSFYIYQLNTMLMHSRHINENPKRNICWATPELKLFEEVQDGKLIGLNEEVLKILAKLYMNAPEERLGLNLTPYLSQEEKVSADYEDAEKRQWLEREYKFLVANRPRLKLEYELYAWEKIYKLDNKTRFMERKMRPFELFIKPSDRRLDERKPGYIPRALRPDMPRNKGRNAKEFFP